MPGIRNPVYYPFNAGGTVRPNRIVKIGAADQAVVEAAAAADLPVGVSAPTVTVGSGERVDVVMSGVHEVIAGGAVTRGTWVASDANGAAVAASPAAGVNNGVIGVALESAVAGDLFAVLVRPMRIQG